MAFLAHTHHPEHSRFGAKAYINTGAWLGKYTYATMCEGVPALWRYRPGENPESLPPIDQK